MIQNKFNIKLVKEYLKNHPKASNKDLYKYCNARTKSQKSNVRRKKLQLLKQKVDTSGTDPLKIESLSFDNLEKRIVDALNRYPDNAILLGKAIDFVIKVKGGDKEGLNELLDMENFLKHELSEREEKGSPSI